MGCFCPKFCHLGLFKVVQSGHTFVLILRDWQDWLYIPSQSCKIYPKVCWKALQCNLEILFEYTNKNKNNFIFADCVTCFFIDQGLTGWSLKANLRELDPKFKFLAPRVFQVELKGTKFEVVIFIWWVTVEVTCKIGTWST